MDIPVIDIFAGPGGLGEGFSAAEEDVRFNIRLSVEMDPVARQTLKLRSFLRAFGYGNFPEKYYKYLSDPEFSREQLYKAYPAQAKKADEEAWEAELGKVDFKEVHEKIDNALGGKQHWVLLGGPPCQAYSLVGRARMTGLGTTNGDLKGKKLEDFIQKKMDRFYNDHRHTLYKEYLKIVAVHKPTVFVMENVKGILSSKQKDEQPVFERILRDLEDPWHAIDSDESMEDDAYLHSLKPDHSPRYRLFSFVKEAGGDEEGELALGDHPELKPSDYVIRSEDYGIPQKRHRVIILGVLEDYNVRPKTLKKSPKVTVKTALQQLPKLRSGLSKEKDSAGRWKELICNKYTSGTLKKFKDDGVREEIKTSLESLEKHKDRGGRFVKGALNQNKSDYFIWIQDPKLTGTTLHETRGHMTSDLWRYLFVSSHAKAKGNSPKVDEFPEWLLPEHKNVKDPLAHNKKKKKEDEEKPVHFRDRFRVQLASEPATTITSHISKDGHYYIHYDPAQCRSLTVREAARLQTFKDNYFFEGNRTQQYHQVGNAVPPLLAKKLAHVVADVIEQCIEIDESTASDSAEMKEAAA